MNTLVSLSLRRTAPGDCAAGRHQAEVNIGQEEARYRGSAPANGTDIPKSDPRWPARCAGCGYEFQPQDGWQVMVRPVPAAAGG